MVNRYIELLVRKNVVVVNLIKILTLRMGEIILYKRENLIEFIQTIQHDTRTSEILQYFKCIGEWV